MCLHYNMTSMHFSKKILTFQYQKVSKHMFLVINPSIVNVKKKHTEGGSEKSLLAQKNQLSNYQTDF